MKRILIPIFSLLVCALAGSAQAAATRPNIILVMPDDVGYGDYACLGNPIMRTPSVDAFKKESLLFTQFHVSPTCAPTRAALMSGRHEFKNGVTHTILERERVTEETAKFFGMLENVDTNFGKLLAKLKEWGLADNTLVIYLASDNGGTEGVKIFNAGMKGGKNTTYQGGTRVPCFFRWPVGGIPAGAECDALSAHLDLFPTLAEITGATLSAEVKQQVEGRSLLPLLKIPRSEWADRTLVHHTGRWAKGKAADAKYAKSGIQNSRFTLVNNDELYDLKADPGEKSNVIAAHPEVVAKLRAAYDQWWADVQPLLVNENVSNAPSINPFQELYYKQFGGSPTAAALRRMDPKSSPDGGGAEAAPRKGRAKAAK